MSYVAGQPRLPYVDVTGYGVDTAASVVVKDLSTGATVLSAAGTGNGSGRWTANDDYVLAAGQYLEIWTVTGTGATTVETTVEVAPSAVYVPAGRVYATVADYAGHLRAAPPSGALRALEVASTLVDEMLFTANYPTDDDLMPTDAAHIVAFRQATCQQAEFARTGADANLVGAARATSFSIGKLSVSRQASKTGAGLGGLGPRGEWSPRAWATLQAAGLTGHEPQSW